MASPHAVWLSSPHVALVEIAARLGGRRFVLDLEHGAFDPERLDALLALIRALGAEGYAKVEAPEPLWVQRALDRGFAAVIAPHVEGVRHAAALAAALRYPPRGRRSFAGGRGDGWGGAEAAALAEADRATRFWPMVETAGALAEVEAILAVEGVDGVFVGPTDLALSRGRDGYGFEGADRADLARVAAAARGAGKPWIMPAWTPAERDWAAREGAAFMVVADEHGALWAGLEAALGEA